MNTTAAIERVMADAPSPGQRFAIAPMEVCSRTLGRGNEFTVRWAPAHGGIVGNEKADEYARAAARGRAPSDSVPGEYRWEAILFPHNQSSR